ncbi:alpha/beta hydrolase [Kordiimonas sediminis]|uniref:Alpha/beta hydrolase n=1 Tax=Kordiimonas sediminis TaxID=1735581 RepID=A0A919AN27_9PROT|nr:alpha/beta hydrolase [Kordiimonas sediminis]GHF15820.1 alpha/beta hydrolase [Kordiimonas sediminis]
MAEWYHTHSGTDGQSHIWLHGWGQDHTSLDRLMRLFARDGQHRLYDQPGFGKTPKLADGAGTEDYADALAEQVRALGPMKHIFIGHSFGGRVSIQLAARHPDLVKAVILIAGAGIPRTKTVRMKIRSTAIKILGKLARFADKVFGTTFTERFRNKFGSRDYKAAGALRPTFVRVVSENLTSVAASVTAPVLLIYGSEDTETPPEIGQKYAAALPNGRYEELAGFGHLDILSRGTYQCEALIRDFLEP